MYYCSLSQWSEPQTVTSKPITTGNDVILPAHSRPLSSMHQRRRRWPSRTLGRCTKGKRQQQADRPIGPRFSGAGSGRFLGQTYRWTCTSASPNIRIPNCAVRRRIQQQTISNYHSHIEKFASELTFPAPPLSRTDRWSSLKSQSTDSPSLMSCTHCATIIFWLCAVTDFEPTHRSLVSALGTGAVQIELFRLDTIRYDTIRVRHIYVHSLADEMASLIPALTLAHGTETKN